MARNLPKISIITPSYNQAEFIEQTIQSVLSQNYPDLEYIVIDGGSTDGTVDILKKYTSKIKWVSEKDRGQSHAINKGLRMTTGEIIGYLNSDDYLERNSLFKIGSFFAKNRKAVWVTGKCKIVDRKGKEVRRLITYYKNFFLKYLRKNFFFCIVQFISQPATFWRREILEAIGYFDEKLHYSMDYDYWLRLWQKYELYYLDEYLASYRVHQRAKAVATPQKQFELEYQICSRYTQSKIILFLHQLHCSFALLIYRLFFIKNVFW